MTSLLTLNHSVSKIIVFIISSVLFLTNCTNNKVESSDSEQRDKDSVALTKLVRDVYQWYESSPNRFIFVPTAIIESDSSFSEIDLTKLNKDISLLQSSNYFDTHFIDNYKTIGLNINDLLNSGEMIWHVGELPPFGNDADPWCNCQDSPDQYWNNITLSNLSIHKNEAAFSWTWGGDFSYKALAHKENNSWKISYLQGFDKHTFLPQHVIK